MSNSDLCPVCGNSIPAGASECPWCEHQLSPHKSASAKRQLIKTVNIKSDLPDISTAHSRLINALHGAKAQRVRVLKLIHGYGSSGKGGDIFFLVRDYLERDKYSGVFKYSVPGDNFAAGFF